MKQWPNISFAPTLTILQIPHNFIPRIPKSVNWWGHPSTEKKNADNKYYEIALFY